MSLAPRCRIDMEYNCNQCIIVITSNGATNNSLNTKCSNSVRTLKLDIIHHNQWILHPVSHGNTTISIKHTSCKCSLVNISPSKCQPSGEYKVCLDRTLHGLCGWWWRPVSNVNVQRTPHLQTANVNFTCTWKELVGCLACSLITSCWVAACSFMRIKLFNSSQMHRGPRVNSIQIARKLSSLHTNYRKTYWQKYTSSWCTTFLVKPIAYSLKSS